jgi:hypothetical protein
MIKYVVSRYISLDTRTTEWVDIYTAFSEKEARQYISSHLTSIPTKCIGLRKIEETELFMPKGD